MPLTSCEFDFPLTTVDGKTVASGSKAVAVDWLWQVTEARKELIAVLKRESAQPVVFVARLSTDPALVSTCVGDCNGLFSESESVPQVACGFGFDRPKAIDGPLAGFG